MRTLFIFLLAIIFSVLLIAVRIIYFNKINKENRQEKLIGKYILTQENSAVHTHIYNLDSTFFSFNSDMTFEIQTKTPVRTGNGNWKMDVLLTGSFSDGYPLLTNQLTDSSFYLFVYYNLNPEIPRDTFYFIKMKN